MQEAVFQGQKRSKSTRHRKRVMRQFLKEKENGFVLDCLNEEKSKLQTYNSISDKYLNYFVIRVHPNRSNSKKSIRQVSQVSRLEVNEKVNHNRFQDMIKREKAKLTPISKSVEVLNSSTGLARTPHSKVEKTGRSQCILLQEIQNSIKFKGQQTIRQQTGEQEAGERQG